MEVYNLRSLKAAAPYLDIAVFSSVRRAQRPSLEIGSYCIIANCPTYFNKPSAQHCGQSPARTSLGRSFGAEPTVGAFVHASIVWHRMLNADSSTAIVPESSKVERGDAATRRGCD